ncbi:hypothetical protein N0V90_003417 [Kalmusia sp. IMI 367209]|nr:hypothetical protein N0V90_003417 [Kalmusia sp. IMI 367209]
MGSFATRRNILITLCFGVTAVLAGEHYPIYADSDASDVSICDPVPQIPASRPPPSKEGNWLGFGADIYNNHWAGTDALINIDNVNTLDSVCQKKYEPGVSAAPLIEDGIAYYPTFSGLLVALDYKACKTLWRLNITELILEVKGSSGAFATSGVSLASRNTPVSDGDVLFTGTLARALVIAVNKHTGKVIDTLELGNHPLSMLTQSPTLYNHRLFFGVSTAESGLPVLDPSYEPSHHGSMHALEFRHGRLSLVWTTHMIPPNAANISGASVWGSQPSIDPIRNQVFIGTGQLFSLPPEFEECQDANKNLAVQLEHLANEPCLPRNVYQTSVLALDIDTGEINWYRTLGPLDAWNSACVPGIFPGTDPNQPPGPNCPKNIGNDTDFGMAPTFVLGSEYTPGRKDVVVAGQKSGNLYAFSAQTGTVQWAVAAAPGGLEGGLSWGVAIDSQTVYYTAINSNRVNFTLPDNSTITNSAFGAVNLKDGSTKWITAAPRNTSSTVIPVVVNDVVLTGVTGNWSAESFFTEAPGSFIALNKNTGEIIRETILDDFFHAGIAVVKDYVLFGTGYGGLEPPHNGSMHVWKLTPASDESGVVAETEEDVELESKKSELAKSKEDLRKKIEELERQAGELDRLRDEL